MANSDVPFEAHDDRAVDGCHHGNLDDRHHPSGYCGVNLNGVVQPEVRKRVEQSASGYHD
mgnify:CR=1 FL=1